MISALVALTNLFFVSAVFSFNKRKDQPRISVIPTFEVNREFKTGLFGKQTIFDGIENGPKLIKKHYLKDLTLESIGYEKGLPSPSLMKADYSKGSISDDTLKKLNTRKTLGVSLVNHGNFASSNIRVEIILRTYGTDIPYPLDDNIYKKILPRKKRSDHPINIDVNFMNGNEEIFFPICELHGQFREAELILLKIKANGFNYMNKNALKNIFLKPEEIVLYHYKHNYLEYGDISLTTKPILDSFYGIHTGIR